MEGDKRITHGPSKILDETPMAKKKKTQLKTGAPAKRILPTPQVPRMKAIFDKLHVDQSPSVVTVASEFHQGAKYSTGFVFISEPRFCLIFTAARSSQNRAKIKAYYVYFRSKIRKVAYELRYDKNEKFMILIVPLEDGETLRPIRFSEDPARYESVATIAAMAGTKLHPHTPAIYELTGAVGIYGGFMTTPSCMAYDGLGEFVPESDKYFMFNCRFQDNIIIVEDIDNKDHPADLVLAAPVFRLNGDVLGVICGIDSCSDVKIGLHTVDVISCISRLFGIGDDGWDWKEPLKIYSRHFLSNQQSGTAQ